MLHKVATSQEETIAQSLNTVFNQDSGLPCQHFHTRKREKRYVRLYRII